MSLAPRRSQRCQEVLVKFVVMAVSCVWAYCCVVAGGYGAINCIEG